MQKGEVQSKKEVFGRDIMDYVQKQRVEKIVTQINLGVYSKDMIWELALANGVTSRWEATEVEREVKKRLENR